MTSRLINRVTGNFLITFFGSSAAFGIGAPLELEIFLRAAIAASGVAGLSLGYELRRRGEEKGNS